MATEFIGNTRTFQLKDIPWQILTIALKIIAMQKIGDGVYATIKRGKGTLVEAEEVYFDPGKWEVAYPEFAAYETEGGFKSFRMPVSAYEDSTLIARILHFLTPLQEGLETEYRLLGIEIADPDSKKD